MPSLVLINSHNLGEEPFSSSRGQSEVDSFTEEEDDSLVEMWKNKGVKWLREEIDGIVKKIANLWYLLGLIPGLQLSFSFGMTLGSYLCWKLISGQSVIVNVHIIDEKRAAPLSGRRGRRRVISY